MASVRMTNELRNSIHGRAMEAFNTARPQPKASTWLADRIRDAVLDSPPYKKMKEWFDRYEADPFKSFGGPPRNLSKDSVSYINLTSHTGFHGGGHANTLAFEFVPGITVYRASSWGAPDVLFEELTPTAQSELAESCRQLSDDIRQWHADHNEYSSKIRNLLEECTTVKQMLTAWPAGESFVPRENINRMYTKVTRLERVKQIKEEVQFDDSFVNQVVLTAKLVGG